MARQVPLVGKRLRNHFLKPRAASIRHPRQLRNGVCEGTKPAFLRSECVLRLLPRRSGARQLHGVAQTRREALRRHAGGFEPPNGGIKSRGFSVAVRPETISLFCEVVFPRPGPATVAFRDSRSPLIYSGTQPRFANLRSRYIQFGDRRRHFAGLWNVNLAELFSRSS
jgi:hypothetical protein